MKSYKLWFFTKKIHKNDTITILKMSFKITRDIKIYLQK